VKKKLLFVVILFYTGHCLAQKIVARKDRPTDMVTEKYQTIIQDNKQIKQGIYNAFYDRTTVIANGNFVNDKKTGIWHFYDQDGKLIENYNYDTRTLLYEAAEESSSNIRYVIDYKIAPGDVATKPVRIGGRYYGYVPYLKTFKLPADMVNINRADYVVVLELLVSTLGRLADFKIHLRSANYERVINMGTDKIDEDDRRFLPASWNQEPTLSTIFIQCYITKLDGLDM
jgi:hypothetical protein